jgi:hypothetical protein
MDGVCKLHLICTVLFAETLLSELLTLAFERDGGRVTLWSMAKPKYTHCPLCYTELEQIDVAPCAECGHLAEEIEHALAGKHTYSEMRIFGDLSIVVCNFCQVDFDSFLPEYFALTPKAKFGFAEMQFVRGVDVFIGKDKFCSECHQRLAFLKFVAAAREIHEITR